MKPIFRLIHFHQSQISLNFLWSKIYDDIFQTYVFLIFAFLSYFSDVSWGCIWADIQMACSYGHKSGLFTDVGVKEFLSNHVETVWLFSTDPPCLTGAISTSVGHPARSCDCLCRPNPVLIKDWKVTFVYSGISGSNDVVSVDSITDIFMQVMMTLSLGRRASHIWEI